MWNAAWLQEHMRSHWRENNTLLDDTGEPLRLQQFALAIVGAGGTGKTAILKSIEALTTFFAGPDTVRKLAPSNAAARLLHGDTLHSLCKLPFGKACLSSKRGRLSREALQNHRKQWRSVIAAYIDEVSTLSSKKQKTFPYCFLLFNLCVFRFQKQIFKNTYVVQMDLDLDLNFDLDFHLDLDLDLDLDSDLDLD